MITEYKKIDFLFKNKEYNTALKGALNLLDKSSEEKDYKIYYLISFLIGDIFKETNNFKKALEYYKKSLVVRNDFSNAFDNNEISLIVENDKDSYLAKSLLMVGSSYQLLGEKDSATVYYNKVLSINSFNDNFLKIKARSYTNLSGLYFKESNYNKAKSYSEKAITIHEKQGDNLLLSGSISNLANIYLAEKKLEKAKELYFRAIRLIENNKDLKSIKNKELFYDNLSWTLYNQKDYVAWYYLDKSFSIRDSLREVEIRDVLAEIEGKHNVDLAKREGELKRQKAQRNTWILGVSSFFIIVLLVFFLNQYKLKQRNLGLELSRQDLVQQQKIEKVRSESQIRILNATLDGKETERKQIAETLHDSVSALLSSANLHLQACKKQFNGSTPIEVDKSQSIINEASQKIRDLSHTLVSSILLKFGLSYAIKDIAEKYSNSQIKIDYETKYTKRYDQKFEIKLYNIIQEFVNNILKHSEASYAKITLVEKNKKLHLRIEDDGKGFDKTLIPEKDGLGINQIDARIQVMQGKFHIESGKGKGTVISVELPVFEKKLEAIS